MSPWAVVVPPPLEGAHCEVCGTGRWVAVYEYGSRLMLLDYRCAAILLAELVAPGAPEAAGRHNALVTALHGHRHRALLLTALAAGLREGELLGLTWPAVNLERGTVEVRWQLERTTHLLVEPKRESRRRIDLPPDAIDALREHRKRQMKSQIGQSDWDPRSFVFTTATGQPLTAGVARRALRSLLGRLGLPLATTHQLRHTFVTTALEEGVALEVVSKLAGHRDIGTTANVYGHLTDRQRSDAAERMGRALRRKA